MLLDPKLEKVYKLAVVRGLYRIAARVGDVEIAPSPMGTAHTDGSRIVIDPAFLEKTSFSDLLFVVAHEYYHIIYNHIERAKRKKLDMRIYNIAGDVIINEHLEKVLGFTRLSGDVGGIFRDNPLFKGMPDDVDTSEKVYKWLIDNHKNPSAEDDMGDLQDDSKEADDTPENAQRNRADRLAEEGEQRKRQAGGKKASKEIFDTLEKEHTPSDDLDWIDLLTAMRIESGKLVRREIVHNYARPSRREEPAGIILPAARHTTAMPKIDVYIDVSGSMHDTPLAIFSGLKSILSQLVIYQPRFFSFDTGITPLDMYRNKLNLGGGTDIRKVLEKIQKDSADLAIVITDCEDSIQKSDFKKNTIVVSNNKSFADFYTEDWLMVRRLCGDS